MSLNHERVQPILRVDGLNVELKIRNKQKKLVENVSFEVEPGQCRVFWENPEAEKA